MTGEGITELKDVLWRAITDESNRLDTDIIHRPLDGHHRVREEDEFIFSYTPGEDDADEEAEDLRKISADQWGEDYDWDDAEFEDEADGGAEEGDNDDDAFLYEAINDDK